MRITVVDFDGHSLGCLSWDAKFVQGLLTLADGDDLRVLVKVLEGLSDEERKMVLSEHEINKYVS